jgi:SAM-dependent methyltransferase
MNISDKSLIYGEIIPLDFLRILDIVESKFNCENKEFIDLGCGTGKAVIICALGSQKFKICRGIEIIPDLLQIANEVRVEVNKITSFCHDKLKLNEQIIPINKKNRGNKKEDEKKKSYALSKSQFIDELKNIIIQHNQPISMNDLTNIFISKCNHRIYRDSLHSQGKFSTFLSQVTNDTDGRFIFQITNDLVTLNDTSLPGIISDISMTCEESKQIISHQIDDSDNDYISSNFVFDKNEELLKICSSIEFQKYILPLSTIIFEQGNIFDIPWWETSDVVYVASLLFSEDMMIQLSQCASKMKKGSCIITLSPLINLVNKESSEAEIRNEHVLFHESFFKMSWQMAKVYIYSIV